MSEDVKISLTRFGIVIGALAAGAALLGAYVILPYRMDAAEKAIRATEQKAEIDHSLLQRIDERTMKMEKVLDRLDSK